MKNYYKFSTVILVMSILSACSVKTTGSKNISATATSPIGTGGPTTTPVTPPVVTPAGENPCGIPRDNGATECYFKIPTIQVMGPTSAAIAAATPYWSSTTYTASGTGISPGNFVTDRVFNVRIIPRLASSTVAPSNPSVAGKTCNGLNNAKKLFVQIKLRQQNATSGELATLTAAIDTPSNVWHFTNIPVSTGPLVLEVVRVEADIRCNWSGGSGSYCPYADIPINSVTKTYPTECVAFDIQYSTDYTQDLPGAPAN